MTTEQTQIATITTITVDLPPPSALRRDDEALLAAFTRPNMQVRVPLWSTMDCDGVERTRLDFVRHKQTHRFLARVTRNQDDAHVAMDPTPLLDGSVHDPWSEAVAAMDAGLFLSLNDQSRIFGYDSLFYLVWKQWNWREIPKCYGRYTQCRQTLAGQEQLGWLTPNELVWQVMGDSNSNNDTTTQRAKRIVLPDRTDPIHLLHFLCGGGLLSYEKQDGKRFVHTLNSPSGWSRKLYSLGLAGHVGSSPT